MGSSRIERVASLDLVRGAAAFCVAIPHYFVLNSTDWQTAEAMSVLSVEVFFVLSGFVLAPQIIFCSRDGRLVNLLIFLVRRWMRTILPFLVALAAISVLVDQLLTADFFRYAFYVQNAYSQHNIRDYFPVAWSLSVEEWFYVTFPLLIFVCVKAFRRVDLQFALIVVVVFIVAITVLRTVFGDLQTWDAQVRRVTLFRIDSIGYGFLLYLIIQRLEASWGRTSAAYVRPVLVGLLIGLSVLGLCLTMWAIAPEGGASRRIFPFVAAAFAMSAIALSYLSNSFFDKPYLGGFCIYLGRISYSVYLFHIMLILLLRPSLQQLPLLAQLFIYVAGCVIFCGIFYQYFEKPILAARPKFKLGRSPELGVLAPQARSQGAIAAAVTLIEEPGQAVAAVKVD
jgi:peptidoglycan/LPS O-acetylase OafA/YrhL